MAETEPQRRFPRPWKAVSIPGGYSVLDANGSTVAWVYGREHRHIGQRGMTPDEARRIATNIAKLPELLDK